MPRPRRDGLIGWSLSLLIVLAAHAGLIWQMMSHVLEIPVLNQPMPAIELDMLPPQPAPVAKPEPQPKVYLKPVPNPPAPQVQPETPPAPEETPTPPKPQVQAAVAPTPAAPAEVALPQQQKPAKPRVTPKPAKKPPASPPSSPPKAQAVDQKVKQTPPPASSPPKAQAVDQKVKQTPPPASSPPPSTPQPVEKESKPAESAATIAEKSNWLGVVVDHIARFKRRPPKHLLAPLRVIVVFNIDRTGKLLSERILQSSGDAEVDDAALAWINRADPLPKPPDDMSETDLAHGFVIPVDFLPR